MVFELGHEFSNNQSKTALLGEGEISTPGGDPASTILAGDTETTESNFKESSSYAGIFVEHSVFTPGSKISLLLGGSRVKIRADSVTVADSFFGAVSSEDIIKNRFFYNKTKIVPMARITFSHEFLEEKLGIRVSVLWKKNV